MKLTGARTKTQAVKHALADIARRQKMEELFSQGLGLTPDELKAEFAPTAADLLDSHGLRVRERRSPWSTSSLPIAISTSTVRVPASIPSSRWPRTQTRCDFATCGMVVLEVCRGRRGPTVLQRFHGVSRSCPTSCSTIAISPQRKPAALAPGTVAHERPDIRTIFFNPSGN